MLIRIAVTMTRRLERDEAAGRVDRQRAGPRNACQAM